MRTFNYLEDALMQPHCLICGSTGSGKSTMINSLLYTSVNIPCHWVIIDLKMNSLIDWDSSPRLEAYADTPADAVAVLDKVEKYMMRVQMELKARHQKETDRDHIYVIVDECADLLATVPESYAQLKRIARLGRSARVHLMLASQSPNRKVLPADLVLNIPARVGLRCQTAIESRQIINSNGCELLPRYGEAMYVSPTTLQPVRVEAPYVSDEMIEDVIRGDQLVNGKRA